MELNGKRFLVTGGAGFIGSHLVEALLDHDVSEVVVFDQALQRASLSAASERRRVCFVEGDVRDFSAVCAVSDGVAGVFHLAVLPLDPCVDNPRLCLDVNVVGTFNVIEAAHKARVTKIVFSSASSVYGDTRKTMDESHPLEARTLYGASKIAGEYLLRAFSDQYGLEYVVLRYMNIYGPRQAIGLIPSVLRRVLVGESPTIIGDGSQSFDFLHVADVALANVAAMASDVTDEAFNIGSGSEVTVKEIVEQLIKLTASDVQPHYDREARVLMTRRVGSNEKAVRMLGWRPRITLEDGLRDLIRAERT